MNYLVAFLILLLANIATAAPSCGTEAVSFLKGLKGVSRESCMETLKSPACQDLFSKMRENGEKPEEKALKCHDQGTLSRAFENYWSFHSGCAVGGWNFVKDTFVGVGTALGEGVAQIVLDHEAEVAATAACEKDPKGKENLFKQYNSSVPKLLQVQPPAPQVLARANCATVKSVLKMQGLQKGQEATALVTRKIGMKNPNYTADEQEFMAWSQGQAQAANIDLVGMAKARLKEMGVQLECYNTQAAAAMMCEAIAEVATLAGGPVGATLKAAKAKNIMKIAGVGSDASKASSAGRAVAAAADLEKAAKLSNVERVAAAEKSLGRALTETEKKALIQAHEVGQGTGRGYGTYSASDLSEKARLLKGAGFKAEERDVLLRQGLAGSLSDTKVARDFANKTRLSADKMRVQGDIAGSTNEYRKAADSYEVFINDAKAMKSERDYWVGAKLNASAERYDKAAEYFIKTETKTARTDQKASNIFEALRREKDELRVIAARNPGSKSAQKAYEDHRKLIEAVTNSTSLQMSDALKRELLKP